MVGTFLLYAVLSGLMLALGWLSWSTPAFIFVAFVPLWVAAYKLFRAQARHAFALLWLITFTAFLEHIQMFVIPAKSQLDHRVKFTKGDLLWNQHTPPYWWFAVSDGYL